MAAADRCKYDAHVALASWIAGAPLEAPVCGKAVACRAHVALHPVPGVTLRIEADVCDEHQARIARSQYYTGVSDQRLPT